MYELPSPPSHKFLRAFKPAFIANSVADINFSYLRSQGIKALYIDLDGTVVARGQYEVSETVRKALRNQPLAVFIATNRHKNKDLKNLQELLHANGTIHPKGRIGKPFKTYYRSSLKQTGLKPNEILMVGDRYFQDIWGANRAGLTSLVVHKIDKPVNRFDSLLSFAESFITNYLQRSYKKIK